MNHRRHYSIFDKQKIVGAIVLAVILIAIGVLVGMAVSQAEKQTWDVCYEMPNRNIEWSYFREAGSK